MGDRIKAKTTVGYLEIGEARVECYVLEDGKRVITERGAVKALTNGDSHKRNDLGQYLGRLPGRFAELATRPAIEFSLISGGVAHGRDARWFVEVCQAYVDAYFAGELHAKQYPLAKNASAFLRAAAVLGVETLIDEATGHVGTGEDSAHARFVRELFREQPREWARFWPVDIVDEMCRVFGVQKGHAFPAPLLGVVGRLYRMRLGEEAHDELKRRNPRGEGRDMRHQHFGDRLFDVLRNDLGTLMTLLRMSRSKAHFWELWGWHCTGRGQLALGW